ncbi:hypothetical protein L1049_000257 [Liquidambar formosana]|uniref:Late embryogenesis abundant protein LEA-2 subgroup domain-containing protein n=1 Tax=Liquidambar formosana TaxID=63359 RepID=A0AAP0NB44_LIQFO
MTTKGNPITYTPLPSHPDHQNVVVLLPLYRSPDHRRRLRLCLLVSALLLLFSAAVFFLYPSDPDIQLVRLHLNRIQVHSSPKISLDLSFSVTIKVRNRDFFSLDYNSLIVSVEYRGRELGFVKSNGEHVRARGSSYVDAAVDVDGLEVVHDVFYLLEDLAKGSIPFDTDTQVQGKLGLFFFEVPLKARVSCEVLVNTNNQTIIRQDCYPE